MQNSEAAQDGLMTSPRATVPLNDLFRVKLSQGQRQIGGRMVPAPDSDPRHCEAAASTVHTRPTCKLRGHIPAGPRGTPGATG